MPLRPASSCRSCPCSRTCRLCVSIDTAFSEEKRSGVEQQGTCSDRLLTSKEVRMVLMVSHARDVAAQSIDGLDYSEWMLTSQL